MYKSKFECKIAEEIEEVTGFLPCYEGLTIPYTQPAIQRRYKPDWLLPNGIIIETKGRFSLEDRKKHLYIQEQYPDVDIRFVFYYNNKLTKRSKTTYGQWCDKQGFKWAVGSIPEEWYKEKKYGDTLWATDPFIRSRRSCNKGR